MTREQTCDEARAGIQGNSTVFAVNLVTVKTRPETSTNFVHPTMWRNGWKKSGDEKRFHCLRGVYIKRFENPITGNVLQSAEEDFSQVRNALSQGIQAYAQPEQTAEIHMMLTQVLLYDEMRMKMMDLPFTNEDNP